MIKTLISGMVVILQLIAMPVEAQTFHVQNLSVSGTVTVPNNSVAVGALAQVAANTVLANPGSTTSTPTAVAMPGCTGTQALTWTTNSGFSCIGILTTASPSFTGTLSVANSSGNGISLDGSANTTNGAIIRMIGTGGTTPNKFLQVSSGVFSINNSANNNQLFTLDDSGNAAFDGTVTAGGFPNAALTGTPTAPTASTATNSTQVATTAWGYNLLASPPTIGGTTPGSGSFTTLSATGLITPSQTVGIKGTTTNNNVQAGSVGEFVSNTNSSSMSSGAPTNCVSQALTAGDWEVYGTLSYTPSGGTSISSLAQGFSTSSSTLPSAGQYNQIQGTLPSSTQVCTAPIQRISVASTTTVYLVGQTSYSGGSMTCNGYLNARRMR